MTALAGYTNRDRLAGVICLSTPFIHIALRRDTLSIATFLASSATAAGVSILAATLAKASVVLGFWAMVSLIYAAGLALYPLCVRSAVHFRRVAIDSVRTARLATPGALPVLLLRSPADETSFGLGFAQALVWCDRKVMNFVEASCLWLLKKVKEGRKRLRADDVMGPLIGSVILVPLCIAFIFGLLYLGDLGLRAPACGLFLGSVAVLGILLAVLSMSAIGLAAALSVAAAPLLLLASAVLCIFGGLELSAIAPFIEVSVEPSPPGRWVIDQMKPPILSREGLRHSLTHSDPVALDVITSWILTRVRLSRADTLLS
jgi:hypothetical protein